MVEAHKQPCKVCLKPIPGGALKCTECDSYQDFSRHLLRWSRAAVAVLGLLPLWGIATALQEMAFTPDEPVIQAALTSCARNSMTVAYINAGTIDGIVVDHDFALIVDGETTDFKYEVRPLNQADFVVSPGASPILLEFQPYNGGVPTNFVKQDHGLSLCQYRLIVKWVGFDGSEHQSTRVCPCPD